MPLPPNEAQSCLPVASSSTSQLSLYSTHKPHAADRVARHVLPSQGRKVRESLESLLEVSFPLFYNFHSSAAKWSFKNGQLEMRTSDVPLDICCSEELFNFYNDDRSESDLRH